MEATYFYMALVVGLCISLLVEEFLGINCGGTIVPGYLAMVCDDIPQMLLIFAIAMIVYVIVNFGLPHFVILFGRRKFVATLIVGVVIKLIVELLFPMFMPFTAVAFRGLGVIVPALIASSCAKQSFKFTIPAILISAYLTFGIVTLLFWVF